MKRVQAQPDFSDGYLEDDDFDGIDEIEELIGVDEVDDEVDSELEFPREHYQPLRGLLFTGSLVKNFTYAGHEFLICTLTEGQVLKIGQLMATYKGTFSADEARRCFTVAACVKSVDGYSLITDIKPRLDPDDDGLLEKINVVKQWYPPVIRYVYNMYIELESTEFAVMSSLKK